MPQRSRWSCASGDASDSASASVARPTAPIACKKINRSHRRKGALIYVYTHIHI